MNAPVAHDLYIALPLEGAQLIEASAGTGKTFTLATLVTRLVVERGLRIGQVLAVTYTEAATQELRKRIRERLEDAARVAGAEACDADKPGAAASRAIVERHLAGGVETRGQLTHRLHQAALEIDLAAIFTIHGFCARVLRDHALLAGQPFDAPTVVPNDTDLRDEVAADLWRVHAGDAGTAPLVAALWNGPKQLASDLRALLSREPLRPGPPPVDDDPGPGLEAAVRALCKAFATHGERFRGELEAAIAGKVLHNGTYKAAWVASCWRRLEQWATHGDPHAALDPDIDRLTPEVLLKKTSKACQGRTPQSPLCAAVEAFLAARTRYRAWQDARATAFLHRVRAEARARMAELKRVRRLQTYDDMIDGVSDALAAPGAEALVAALRDQYRVALVDEFQDTDPRQWAIFAGVFGRGHAGEPPALFLVGDPKQAIYGFRGGDLQTYLAASEQPGTRHAPALDRNFRSRPAVLRAIGCLYATAAATGDPPFVDPRIAFRQVEAGRRVDGDYVRDGVPAPGLTIRRLSPDDGKDFKADSSRAVAARACVDAIHAVLRDARDGRARLDGAPVVPGDIAVLVRTHREATRIRQALAAAGIPAVAAGRQSLFATDEALELLALFESLLQPADDGRLRTALATVLVGVDAAAIAALDEQAAVHAGHQRDAQARRERWQRSGPLALVSDLCAGAAERLLGLQDGERRLTNYLQLAELLQEARARAPGLHGQVSWLRDAIADADADDDTQLLRLESDAACVQVVTLHKSKGLEYPLVFLPFAGIGGRGAAPGRHCVVHDGGRRVLHWKIDKASQAWQDACEASKREQRAEDARLLYVALTRASHALWLAAGPFYNAAKTPLAAMLGGDAPAACEDILVVDGPLPPPPEPLPAADERAVPAPRVATRVLPRDWWVHSFTQLMKGAGDRNTVRAIATGSEAGAADEAATPDAATDEPFDPRFTGARFGDVLHDAFEHVDFGAWRDWRAGPAPDGQDAPLRAALRRGGYAGRDLDDGVEVLVPLVGHGLVTTLPEGIRLCDLAGDARRAEMEFHFALQSTAVDALIDLLHSHGVLRERDGFGARRTLEGLMTGKIDLAYTAGGRWFLLDYKSNRLPAYDAPALDAAMAQSGYDLQALVYTVALHRWLRFRLGAGYDYARDFGGVRYLFCRGLAAGDGVHAHRPAPALLHALDGLFAGTRT